MMQETSTVLPMQLAEANGLELSHSTRLYKLTETTGPPLNRDKSQRGGKTGSNTSRQPLGNRLNWREISVTRKIPPIGLAHLYDTGTASVGGDMAGDDSG